MLGLEVKCIILLVNVLLITLANASIAKVESIIPTTTYWSIAYPSTTPFPIVSYADTTAMHIGTTTESGNPLCINTSINIIQTCYITYIFNKFSIDVSSKAYLEKYQTLATYSNGVKQICDAKKDLDTCLGSAALKCFDSVDFDKVPFAHGKAGRSMVANYLQMNYMCGSVYNLALTTTDCFYSMVAKCNNNENSCDNYNDYIQCEVQRTVEACGVPAGCYIRKYLTLETCYSTGTCGICSSFFNKTAINPVDNLCHDDQGFESTTLSSVTAYCSDYDYKTINVCYKTFIFDYFGISADADTYLTHFRDLATSSSGVKQICSAKKDLDGCLGSSIIKNCFDVEDFKNVEFVDGSEDARIMVTNYYQVDYACSNGVYDVALKAVDCIYDKMTQCDMDTDTCSEYSGYISCEVQRASDKCGKAAGCFLQKYLTLDTCYDELNCGICSSFANKPVTNPVGGLCSDDGSENRGNQVFVFNFNLLIIIFCFKFI